MNDEPWHQTKVMKSFIPSTCGCVHLQHTVLCTWEASWTSGCTWTVVSSPALTHTYTHTHSHRQTDGGVRPSRNQTSDRLPDLASQCYCWELISFEWMNIYVILVSVKKHHESYSPGFGETATHLFPVFYFSKQRSGCDYRTTDYTSSLVTFQCRHL